MQTRARSLLAGVALLSIAVVHGMAAAATASPASGQRSAAALPALTFDRILRYHELTRLLQGWAAARPALVQLESIGRTPEGRELWFLTITNTGTGPAAEKPALLVDGHMHAIEGPGNVAALNFAWTLLRDYGTDERVTRLLDTRTIYVLPRLTPDGVEVVLRDKRIVRSAIRPAQGEVAPDGLRMRDLDGDGRIVFMRYRDPRGPWKAHATEARLLVPRAPADTQGEFWRVVPEGEIEGYDGTNIAVPPALAGIDFGVHFPDAREPAPQNTATGPDPARAPEVAAYAAAILARPNIVTHVSCHSFGGGILMPPVNADEHMPQPDRLAYDTLAARGAELTTYDPMTYLHLRGGQELDVHIPTEIGWLYNRLGIYAFITEFWNPLRAAGIELEGPMSLWLGGQHPVEDDLKLLRWNDTELQGRGFVPWHAFQHPQLGAVEIGGWDKVNFWYNAPFARLRQEVAPHAAWLTELALASPRLELRSVAATPIGEQRWRVRAVLQNTGWLPTNGSQRALDVKAVGGIVTEIALPQGARLIEGERVRDAGQLVGLSEQHSLSTWWSYAPGTPDLATVDWVVEAADGAKLGVVARHARAGVARAQVVLRLQGSDESIDTTIAQR
ncbi:MAG TPA: M14 family metallopeptidase [Steroidobacteraceae bacterium]|nr:M14 family metallopeptidase [Steroidobacteraceae bacterium]